MTQMVDVRPEEIAALTKADRCDTGCSAAAAVATLIPYEGGTGVLVWCDHHYRQHEAALVEIAGAIRDERAQLTNDRLKGAHNG